MCTGFCLSPVPANTPNEKTLHVQFCATPAVLETATPSIEKFPLEWKSAKLRQIIDDLCAEHGISVAFWEKASARFKRVDIDPGSTILPFITKLSSQRGLLLSSGRDGSLLVHSGAASGDIISFIASGKHPTKSFSLKIDDGAFFSSVTGIVKKGSRKTGARFSVQNPFKTDVVRAYNFSCKDIEPGELWVAVKAAAGRMFANTFRVVATVSTWRSDLGDVYYPGQLVSVQSEDNFIPYPYTFMIAQVDLSRDSHTETATLHLTFPGAYSGEMPEVLPWRL
jgi:prophage tail gpP-like protein